MTCAACDSNSLGRFQAGCPECYVRHTAILHPDERQRRYMAVFTDKGREAAEAFIARVNAARKKSRESRK